MGACAKILVNRGTQRLNEPDQNANNSHYYYVYISFFSTSESEDDEDDDEEEEEGRRAVASLTLSSKIFCFCAISSFKSLISLFFF